MPVLRIVKQYNKYSKLSGIIEVDRISFNTKEEGREFVAAVSLKREIGFDIKEAEWAMFTEGGGA
jgi:hypothetical protein